jgi:energy-coupling factor transport system ATP-binding protein
MFSIGPFEYKFKNQSKKIFCESPIIIKKNELVLITGPSGSGKSTMLKMLKGIIPEYTTGQFTGTIHYNDQPLFGEFFKKNLSEIVFLFQNPFSQLIYPNVAEEFFFSMENFNFSKEKMIQKKNEFENSFRLKSLWNKKTIDLSHGECQRLVLSSLLAIEPQVLLLDEPTAFLDPEARVDFYQWLKKIKGKQTIIIVDHHLNEILPLADKIINVNLDGQVTSTLFSKQCEPGIVKTIPFPACQKSTPTFLELKKINFHYSDQKKLLKDITINTSNGNIIVIRGKNGNGKSTLFKIIAGLIKPISGTMKILQNGKELPFKKISKEIGFIFQNSESHFFYDTIAEELAKIENRNEMDTLLESFFYNIELSRSPFLLSEGEKRRLTILMTVFLKKNILLYDEPTFGQDQESITKIKELINYLRESGKIQIIISHDEEFIQSLNAKVFDLRDGELVENL